MGWAIGYDDTWKRDIGYGVPSECDHPECRRQIHRGLAYVCGGEPYGGEEGCGLFFCGSHLQCGETRQVCERCAEGKEPFEPKEDVAEWIVHKLHDPSWRKWRDENPSEVAAMKNSLLAPPLPGPPPTRAKVGETPQVICNALRVFLDDVEQHHVIEADVEAGLVVSYATDEAGELIISGDELLCQELRGRVRLQWRD